jgi:hypothetical protein
MILLFREPLIASSSVPFVGPDSSYILEELIDKK